MSRTLSMNCGSGESLNASVCCGAQRERPPDPTDRALAHPGRRRHRTRRPMRRVRRLLLERLHDHPLNILICDRARLPWPRLVVEPIDPALREPHPPLPHRRGVTAERLRYLNARAALGSGENDPTTKRERLRRLRPPSPTLQHLPLLARERDLRPLPHRRLQSSLPIRTTSTPTRRSLRTNDSGH